METYIKFSLPNLITVTIMALLGTWLVSGASSMIQKMKG